jgi:hypothetical protein
MYRPGAGVHAGCIYYKMQRCSYAGVVEGERRCRSAELQMRCRGAEVQRCRDAEVQMGRGTEVQMCR